MKKKEKSKYDVLIDLGLEKAEEFEPGSAERVKAIEYVEKLQKMKLEEERTEGNKKDKWIEWTIKIVLGVFEIAGPLALGAVLMNKGFEFEENGTITSWTFKNLIGKFIKF